MMIKHIQLLLPSSSQTLLLWSSTSPSCHVTQWTIVTQWAIWLYIWTGVVQPCETCMCTQSVGSISVIHMGIQERKKRTEEKKQRRLENQKKAEVVQKVSIVISWTPPPSRARKERRVRELSRGRRDLALSPMLHSESSGSSQLFSFSACNIEKLGGAWGRG